jgi:NRAMP (natural resistance-associated macrophage protein)-like metal ion transporter
MAVAVQSKKQSKGPLRRFLRALGPGLITGASDDDPSGIGTYSQAGAQLGFSISWTMLLTFPLMAAIQEISARMGATTGRGIAGNLARHYPAWLLNSVVGLLFVANVINIGADLGAMADALKLLIGGPALAYVIFFGAGSVAAQIFLSYRRYVTILKWTTLSLFTYVAVLLAVHVPWREALIGFVVPQVHWNREFFTMLVAIFGTTISPYLFFWQASQEAEDQRVARAKKPLLRAPPALALKEFGRIRADTLTGMAFSNLIAVAIMIATAATLHAGGVTRIETSAQAAEALRPIAGAFAEGLFALGILGTGLLAVPVLAGASAYAIGEAKRWPVGLGRKPSRAVGFYLALTTAVVIGGLLNFSSINPIAALFWSAVINGVLAVPVMTVMMLLSSQQAVMGTFAVTGGLRVLGWLSTAVMAVSVIAMGLTAVI